MHDYRIEWRTPEAPGEVDIAALVAAPPRLGDHFTIDREDVVYDVVVEQVSRSNEGRWTARCRVFELAWP